MHREADLQPSLDPDPEIFPTDVESDSADKSVEAGLASLFRSSVAADTLPSELVDRAELIRLQQSDPVLFSLFERAEKGDERFFVKPGVLVRTWYDKFTRPECSRPTTVVLTALRLNVLPSAHAGHLGVSKTRSSLLQHFFWPSIFGTPRISVAIVIFASI